MQKEEPRNGDTYLQHRYSKHINHYYYSAIKKRKIRDIIDFTNQDI
jgi:hypothetical protein